MIPIDGQPILTAAQMRAAEDRAVAAGTPLATLMQRAGEGVAEATRRLAVGAEVLVLCGLGNNGGDGYVAAAALAAAGHPVRVAALGEPKTDLARAARTRWTGSIEPFPTDDSDDDAYSPIVVDAVFGTGLSRPVEDGAIEAVRSTVWRSRFSIAVDVPTGVDTDAGIELNQEKVPNFDLTMALGALKPAHVLMPAAELCGTVRLIDLGLDLTEPTSPSAYVSLDATIGRPLLAAPPGSAHKYSRGLAVVIGGNLAGATSLAVIAAMRSGAGYGLLFNDKTNTELPHAVVQRRWSPEAFAEAVGGKRQVVIVIGPGLGRNAEARAKLEIAIACNQDLVIDGDALHLLEERHFDLFRERAVDGHHSVVLTPHAGEFAALFGQFAGSKINAARAAARRSGAIVAFKGPDTVVAHPLGWTNTLCGATPWLSTAGTGDVLAGTIAGVWHSTIYPVETAVWLHAEAARRCGGSFIADDLATALTPTRASLPSSVEGYL